MGRRVLLHDPAKQAIVLTISVLPAILAADGDRLYSTSGSRELVSTLSVKSSLWAESTRGTRNGRTRSLLSLGSMKGHSPEFRPHVSPIPGSQPFKVLSNFRYASIRLEPWTLDFCWIAVTGSWRRLGLIELELERQRLNASDHMMGALGNRIDVSRAVPVPSKKGTRHPFSSASSGIVS